MPLTPIVTTGIVGAYTKTRFGREVAWQLSHELRDQFDDGTATGQVNKAVDDEPAIASGGTKSYDLTGDATLKDPFGDPVNFAKGRALRIESLEANTTNITIGAGANAWNGPLGVAGTLVLQPGGVFLWSSPTGFATIAATGDILQIVNAAGATANVKVTILGTDA